MIPLHFTALLELGTWYPAEETINMVLGTSLKQPGMQNQEPGYIIQHEDPLLYTYMYNIQLKRTLC